MKRILLSFLVVGIASAASAQQIHFTSQYMQHNSMYNPGAAGIANKNMVGLSYRNMWESFPGNPTTYMLYGDFNLPNPKMGVGAYVYRDQTGAISRTGAQIALSKHIVSLGGKNKLGLGIELRGLQYAIDKAKVQDALQNDPVLAGQDSKFAFDAGAGVYFTNDKLSIGLAASQLIQAKLNIADVPNATINGKLYRHYNLTASYVINGGDNVTLIPHGMVRVIEHSPSEYELGMLLDYKTKLWWGLTYRIEQFWSLQAGVKILPKIGFTYSYDFYRTPIDVFTKGSGAHELGLKFDLNKKSQEFSN